MMLELYAFYHMRYDICMYMAKICHDVALDSSENLLIDVCIRAGIFKNPKEKEEEKKKKNPLPRFRKNNK